MAASSRELLKIIAGRIGKRDLDTVCMGVVRCVSKAEAYDMVGDERMAGHLLDIQIALIEERLNEIVEIRDALRAAKNGEAA